MFTALGSVSKVRLALLAGAGTIAATMIAAKPVEDIFRPAPSNLSDLAGLRWKHRVLLIFAPSGTDGRYLRQLALLELTEPGLKARDMLILSDLAGRGVSALRDRFAPDGFRVVLLGKDGLVKLDRSGLVRPADLFGLIDGMPMRRREMREAGEQVPPPASGATPRP
ncbi:DUF4174 domain-containing protein [Salipiger sp.]|uniref:DUF4174 domain-containing protein n=1 Tax=Salipiger sp. TaxID=2078585 RepID=UPI003A9814CD